MRYVPLFDPACDNVYEVVAIDVQSGKVGVKRTPPVLALTVCCGIGTSCITSSPASSQPRND